ncbi:hypothetical protein pEaSNUABM6_00021 [Erwinia phage pEa_SNUABM_6]|nr:hypothetical protein pEaSNUABM6_00021 [Erwinia phage pEa_SNUABM_6]
MHYAPMSAHETFAARGYSPEEGKRIRGYLPRRFGDISNALPLTNAEFWLAYECMKHYNDNSRERGRFYAVGPFNFQSNGKVNYRSEKLNEDFSMVEFIRHFGDTVFTDFDAELGMKVPRTNADGSLVMKNRMVATRLVEIEKQAQPQSEDFSSWHTASWMNFPVGSLSLPPTGMITPETVLMASLHGMMVQEYVNTQAGRMLHPTLDYKWVATYVYLKRLYHARDRQFGQDYHSVRSTIEMNLRFRTSTAMYPSDVMTPPHYFHIDADRVMSANGILNLPRLHNTKPMGFYESLYRFNNNGHVAAITTIPTELFNEYSEEEWKAVLA